ncbi:hypothetical protein RFI_09234, partial [Reticulomyxa filosa]
RKRNDSEEDIGSPISKTGRAADWICADLQHKHFDFITDLSINRGLCVACSKDETVTIWDLRPMLQSPLVVTQQNQDQQEKPVLLCKLENQSASRSIISPHVTGVRGIPLLIGSNIYDSDLRLNSSIRTPSASASRVEDEEFSITGLGTDLEMDADADTMTEMNHSVDIGRDESMIAELHDGKKLVADESKNDIDSETDDVIDDSNKLDSNIILPSSSIEDSLNSQLSFERIISLSTDINTNANSNSNSNMNSNSNSNINSNSNMNSNINNNLNMNSNINNNINSNENIRSISNASSNFVIKDSKSKTSRGRRRNEGPQKQRQKGKQRNQSSDMKKERERDDAIDNRKSNSRNRDRSSNRNKKSKGGSAWQRTETETYTIVKMSKFLRSKHVLPGVNSTQKSLSLARQEVKSEPRGYQDHNIINNNADLIHANSAFSNNFSNNMDKSGSNSKIVFSSMSRQISAESTGSTQNTKKKANTRTFKKTEDILEADPGVVCMDILDLVRNGYTHSTMRETKIRLAGGSHGNAAEDAEDGEDGHTSGYQFDMDQIEEVEYEQHIRTTVAEFEKQQIESAQGWYHMWDNESFLFASISTLARPVIDYLISDDQRYVGVFEELRDREQVYLAQLKNDCDRIMRGKNQNAPLKQKDEDIYLLLRSAYLAHKKLQQAIRWIAKNYRVRGQYEGDPGVKHVQRIIEKGLLEYIGEWDKKRYSQTPEKKDDLFASGKVFIDYASIKDYARAGVTCQGIQQIIEALRIIEKNPHIEILRIKNRFNSPYKGGYKDVLINIRFLEQDKNMKETKATPGDPYRFRGHICEIQLHHEKYQIIRSEMKGHDNYAASRFMIDFVRQKARHSIHETDERKIELIKLIQKLQ